MTQAQKMAELFSNNGQVRLAEDGRSMLQVALDLRVDVLYPNGRGTAPMVYVFGDGSAIVEEDGGWDFRAEGCDAACWSPGCRCGEV